MISKELVPESHIRVLLETEMRRPVSGRLWDLLLGRNAIQDAQTGNIPFSALVREAEGILGVTDGQHAPRKTSHEVQEPLGRMPPDPPRMRTFVISKIFALKANELEVVRDFRDDVLMGQLLEGTQIPTWVKSTAEAESPPTKWIDGVRLPDDRSVEATGERISIDPPMEISEGGNIKLREISFFANGTDGEYLGLAVTSGGVLDRLLLVCNRLTWLFGWNVPLGVSFVLAGSVPIVKPALYDIVERSPFEAISRITLHIDPTISPRELSEYYGSIRRLLMGDRYRGLSVKHLNLALLLAQTSGWTWEQRMAEWNNRKQEDNPDWCYGDDGLRNFARDCNQAEDRLLHPKFSIPSKPS